jgi:kynurenine 3-monooxygenase
MFAILPLRSTNFLSCYIDIRLPSSKAAAQQRSINLAISHRGIAALEAIDAAATQRFMQAAIPMRGRMIHSLKGDLDSQLYDRDGQVSASFSGDIFHSFFSYT